jgi:hypothetical protein
MGQAKNKGRHCPAVGRAITSAECGESRISWRACPAECSHNPWSPRSYDQALAIEQEVYDKLSHRLARELGGSLEAVGLSGGIPHILANFTSAYFFKRDTEGLTFLQRWERKNWIDLNNDERVFLKALSLQKVALIEVLEVRNGEETLVRDRLNLTRPPFVIHDRKLAAHAGRFTTLLCYLVEMPHYARLNGAVISVPMLNGLEAEDVVRAVAEHQAAPTGGDALRQWLLLNYGLAADILAAISAAIHDALLKNAVFTFAWYRIVGKSGSVVAALQHCPDVISLPVQDELDEGMTHEWAWKAVVDSSTPDTTPVLGKVLCGATAVRIQAGGTKSFIALREAFEKVAGSAVQFERQRQDDLGAQRRSRPTTESNPALVPPSLLKHLPAMEISLSLMVTEPDATSEDLDAKLSKHNAQWCDHAISSFGGKTPREAAADPALRPRLINIVKHRIRRADDAGLDGDRFLDETWIVKELGLTELDYPVPPALQVKLNNPDPDDEEFEEDDLRPLSPCLPPIPLSRDDIGERLIHVVECFPDAADLLEAFEEDAGDLYDWIFEWTENALSEEEVSLLLHLAATLWFTVYPPEYAPRGIVWDRFEHSAEQLIVLLRQDAKSFFADESHFQSAFQPELCGIFRDLLMETKGGNIGGKPFSKEAIFLGALMVKLVADELALSAQF